MAAGGVRRWAGPALLAASGLGVGLVAEHEAQVQSGRPSSWTWPDLAAGFAFLLAGLLVRRHRPDNRCWWLLMLTGITWFAGTFAASDDENVSLAGFALEGGSSVLLAWLLLAYPSGRLPRGRTRAVLGLVAGLYVARVLARLFLFVPPDRTGCACVPNRFLPITDRRWFDAIDSAFPWAFTGAFLLVIVAAGVRWKRSSGPGRSVLAPVIASGALVVVELGYSYLLRHQAGLTRPTPTQLFYVLVAARVLTAAAFVAGLRQVRRTRYAVVDLVGTLPHQGSSPDRLAYELRRALSDRELQLVPWSAQKQAYVDAEGKRLDVPVKRAGRATTLISEGVTPVAALVHDEALLEVPGLVNAVAAAVRLTSDNDRLRRELEHQLQQVAESRARIVAAADAERRRIERDLHDGAQQRLVTIALALRLTEAQLPLGTDPTIREALSQAGKDLAEAIEELRDLARGIHPAVLTESGLAVALESLVDRSPLPVRTDVQLALEPPAPISTAAYYAVAEPLSNVAKHARATTVTLHVTTGGTANTAGSWLHVVVIDDGVGGADPSRGSGLAGLEDRIAAAGGDMRVTSPPGGGTTVQVRLPCE